MNFFQNAFKIDPKLSRSISAFDIFLVCVVTFGVFPAVFFAAGYILAVLGAKVDSLVELGGYLATIGYTGLFAWMGIPVFAGIGWIASRKGWVGYGAAFLLGIVGGLIFGIAFWLIDGSAYSVLFVLIFPLPAAVYAIIGWATLRYLRPDIFG